MGAATLQDMKTLGVKWIQALFFPGVNIFKSGLASKNPELRRPASLIEAQLYHNPILLSNTPSGNKVASILLSHTPHTTEGPRHFIELYLMPL